MTSCAFGANIERGKGGKVGREGESEREREAGEVKNG